MKKVAFAGSFDPITNGHLWVIEQACSMSDEVVVLVAHNSSKTGTFTPKERQEMISHALKEKNLSNARVESVHSQYVAQYAKRSGCSHLIRGIRSGVDFDQEALIARANTEVLDGCPTIFLVPPRELASVSSSFVKSLIGPVMWHQYTKDFVPSSVQRLWVQKYVCREFTKHASPTLSQEIIDHLLSSSIEQYSKPSRHYHNLSHIAHTFQELDRYCLSNTLASQDAAIIATTLLMHDYIYECEKDDELKSAQETTKILKYYSTPSPIVSSIEQLIKSTAHFGPVGTNQNPNSLESLVKSIDMSILASPPNIYSQYCQQIKQEYSKFSEADYTAGRKQALSQLLTRELYPNEFFSDYAIIAKHNIINEISSLNSPSKAYKIR